MLFLIVCIISLALGSFANNVISHFAEGAEFDVARSRCLCGKKYLRSTEVVPIFSFALLKGKCSYCRKSIPFRYPVVEILALTLGILAFLKYNFSIVLIVKFMVYYVLLLIGVTDYLSFRIPNKLVSALLILIIAELIFFNESFPLAGMLTGVFISGALYIANYFSKRHRDTALIGMGDLKLIPVLFILFNFPGSLLSLWMAALLGVISYLFIKKLRARNKIPFGAFLSVSFILCDLLSGTVDGYFYSCFDLLR